MGNLMTTSAAWQEEVVSSTTEDLAIYMGGATMTFSRQSSARTTASKGPQKECPICLQPVICVSAGDADHELAAHVMTCISGAQPRGDVGIVYTIPETCCAALECPICMDEIAPGETAARLDCLCLFHQACIDGWHARLAASAALMAERGPSKVVPGCPIHSRPGATGMVRRKKLQARALREGFNLNQVCVF